MHVRGKRYHGSNASIIVSTISLQFHKLNLDAGSGYNDYEGSAGRGKKHHYHWHTLSNENQVYIDLLCTMSCAGVLVAGTLIIWGVQVMDEKHHNYGAPYVALVSSISL